MKNNVYLMDQMYTYNLIRLAELSLSRSFSLSFSIFLFCLFTLISAENGDSTLNTCLVSTSGLEIMHILW